MNILNIQLTDESIWSQCTLSVQDRGLGISDVSWTFPDREIPGKFHKSYSREIFPYSREIWETEVEKNAAI